MNGTRRAIVHVYEANDGWRWRLIASNGRIMADSGEAYTSKSSAVRALDRLRELVGSFDEDHWIFEGA